MPNSESGFFKQKIFYGWYIIGAAFTILFFNAGARYSIGVIFKPVISEFGWSRSVLSLSFFINMIFYALSLTIIGKLYDRFGPKWVIIISTLFLSSGFIGISFISQFWHLLVFYGIIGAIGIGGTSVPIFSALTSKWFKQKRGFAISLALAGNSIGQFVLIPVLIRLVSDIGWRASFFLIALIMLAINILLSLSIIKGDPQDLGISPYGMDAPEERPQREVSYPSVSDDKDLNLSGAMMTTSFWLYTIVMLVCGSGDFFISTHLIPFATDYGISTTSAGSMLALMGLMSFVGMMVAGPLSDRIGNRIPLIGTFALRVFLFLLIFLYKNNLSLYVFSLLFGFTFLITAPLTPTLIGRLYGLSHVGVLSGFITTIHHLAGGFWAYMGGLYFDRTGSYQIMFIYSMILALIATTCCFFIREKRYY